MMYSLPHVFEFSDSFITLYFLSKEATCLQNVPTDLCIRLNITGSKNGSVSVQDINGCHYKRVNLPMSISVEETER